MILHHSIPTNIMEAVDIAVVTKTIVDNDDAVINAKEIGEVAAVVGETLI